MKSLLRILLAFAATTVATFAQTGTAIPGGNQSATYVINKPGRYYLAAHRVMTDPNKNAIEIASDDVTLDLNGHTVAFASSTGTGHGIYGKDLQNTEIRGGSIVSSPSSGIHIDSSSTTVTSSNTRILDVRSSQAGDAGLRITGDAITIVRCSIDEPKYFGIYVFLGVASLIQDCVVDESGGAGIISSCQGSVIKNCVVTNARGDGVSSYGSGQVENCNVSLCNLSNGPQGCGIRATGTTVIRNNLVAECKRAGIHVSITNNLVEGNTIVSSVGHIAIEGGFYNGGVMIGNRYSKNSTIAGPSALTNGGGNIAF